MFEFLFYLICSLILQRRYAIVNSYLSEDYLNSFYNDASTVYAFVGEAIVILIFIYYIKKLR